MIHVVQIRAARAMLNFSQQELAKRAGIAVATLNNLERGAQTDPKLSTLRAIRQTLEKEGIEFTEDAYGRLGVTLKPHETLHKGQNVILIVDDNKADRMLYKHWLGQVPGKSYKVIEAENARLGFDAFMEHAPHCLILDFMMYGADGFQLLAAIKRENVKIPPIIFVTAMHNDALEENAWSNGVYCYLNKQKLSAEMFRQNIERSLN